MPKLIKPPSTNHYRRYDDSDDDVSINPSIADEPEAADEQPPVVYRKWGNECLPEDMRKRCCPPLPKNYKELGISIDVIRALEKTHAHILPDDYVPIDVWEKTNNEAKDKDKDDSGEKPAAKEKANNKANDKDESDDEWYDTLVAKTAAVLKDAGN
jgi:hypothetical protein